MIVLLTQLLLHYDTSTSTYTGFLLLIIIKTIYYYYCFYNCFLKYSHNDISNSNNDNNDIVIAILTVTHINTLLQN